MALQQYQLEYVLEHVALSRLWNMISTEQGLQVWMTGEVRISDDIAQFRWSDYDIAEARVRVVESGKRVRFSWLGQSTYFDLAIRTTELTGDQILVITDFSEPNERYSSIGIWQQQVNRLRQSLGLQILR